MSSRQRIAVFVTDAPDATGVFDGESGARISSGPWVMGVSTFLLPVAALGEGSPEKRERINVMGRTFKVEATEKAEADIKSALLKAKIGDVLDVPHTAMNLTIAGGIVEIDREGGNR